MAVVVFKPSDFRFDFPQFGDKDKYPDKRLKRAFRKAEGMFGNKDNSIPPYDPDKDVYAREEFLYYITCQILTMADWSASGQSGPVASVTEGSVSVSFSSVQQMQGWFALTPCGQNAWQLIKPYLSGGRYYPVKYHHPWG